MLPREFPQTSLPPSDVFAVAVAGLAFAEPQTDLSLSRRIEAALREHSSGGGSAGAPMFPGSGHTLSGAPAPGGAGGEATSGYLKVIAIVGLLWLWYTYGTKGEVGSIPDM